MPRHIVNTASVATRIKQPAHRRLRNYHWVDPFPEMHGTIPEKMVYAELTRRGIPFLFLNDIHFAFPEIGFDKTYQADIILPTLKIIIEVQGAHWHSMPKTINEDAFKLAVYETGGYKALAWWDYDIMSRLQSLFDAVPEISAASHQVFNPGKTGELPVVARTKVDTSKGIRNLNHARFKAKLVKTKRSTLRKATGLYDTKRRR